MDILYLFRHSAAGDFEIRHSLRSVQKYLPYIRKIWILGDRPRFLSDDTSVIEHVPHGYVAGIASYRLPLRNLFLLTFLGSLIPKLNHEFLVCGDDYFMLDHVSEEEMREDRVLENLDELKSRGRGIWKDALWRTYDLLKRLDYPCYNFETHCPAYMTKTRVLEAFCAFRDFVTEDYLYGPLAFTSIQNHACKYGAVKLAFMSPDNPRAGFYAPSDYNAIRAGCDGKKFLNFDDAGFNDDMRRYLKERFPEPSVFETPAPRLGTVGTTLLVTASGPSSGRPDAPRE